MTNIVNLLVVLLPWRIKRAVLVRFWRYDIHASAWIGMAWVFPERLSMGAGSKIGHLTVCKGIALLQLGEHSSIGRLNWISGFPRNNLAHFAHQLDRNPMLVIGRHSAITNRHLIDCTNAVTIGEYSTIAGYYSQLLTHSIDLELSRQSSNPISIGDYAFVGTNCVILGGAILPNNSVLGAKSLLNKPYQETGWLYAGSPARRVKPISRTAAYFTRAVGFVY